MSDRTPCACGAMMLDGQPGRGTYQDADWIGGIEHRLTACRKRPFEVVDVGSASAAEPPPKDLP